MLQTSTIKESTFELLRELQAEPLLSHMRLVGGTALSLQIAHRESEDLDLFSTEPLEGVLLQALLIEKYGFMPSVVQENTLIGFVHGVKIMSSTTPSLGWMIQLWKMGSALLLRQTLRR